MEARAKTIQITNDDKGFVSIKIAGKELSEFVSAFTIEQRRGEIPVLKLEIPIGEDLELDLPVGSVITVPEVDQNSL